jgi:single-strand DNA-binding protein
VTSIVTVEGNLTTDPRLHYTPTGKPVTNLRIAVSTRRKDKASGQYQDTPPIYLDVTVWGATAENTAESLHTGDRILATGTAYLTNWTDTSGQQRTSYTLDAEVIGVSLRYHTATPVKPQTRRPSTADSGPADEPDTDPAR